MCNFFENKKRWLTNQQSPEIRFISTSWYRAGFKSKFPIFTNCDCVLMEESNANCTLSPSAFGKILEQELLKTKLSECDFLNSRSELSIHLGMRIEKNLSKIRDDSQARHETLWLRHHRLLKKQELTRWDTSACGYMRTSEVRRVLPSPFSLLPCLGFSR